MADNDQVAAIARSRAEWASLRRRLETVTPAMLARAGLTVGAGLVVLGVAAGTWPALMPFLVGAVIAYSVLPLVNRLDSIRTPVQPSRPLRSARGMSRDAGWRDAEMALQQA